MRQGARPSDKATRRRSARTETRLTPESLCIFNRQVMLSTRGAALLIVFATVALATLGAALHEHDFGVQADGHAGCDACHFRHLSGIAPDGAPAPAGPALVAQAVAPAQPDRERSAALGIFLTRGPPAWHSVP